MTENQMAQSSAEFIERFAALAKRIASIGVAVNTATLDWSSFGSWMIIVSKRHEAVRFTYDGRDSFITVEASSIQLPFEWKELVVKGIENRLNEAQAFVEEFIRLRFTT